jgi:uncharacterized Zn finger protein
MSRGYYGWAPYVPVAERRAKAAREMTKLSRKNGQTASPVVLDGRKIASTFWGKAWCENLEAYSDYENRLPRGRSYLRNGSVVDLQIEKGMVTARVSGSSLYTITVKIKPLTPDLWKSIQKDCAGQIDSLIELLQGKLSAGVMQIVTRRERGLFPMPKEIDLDCSCPDWADLCKHVAATLYGVGARLDQNPGLLFLLRGVDPTDLISKVSAAEAVRQTTPVGAPVLSETEVADVFGIELEPRSPASVSTMDATTMAPIRKRPTPLAPAAAVPPKPAARKKNVVIRKMSAKMRGKIEDAIKMRWAYLKKLQDDKRAAQAMKAKASKEKPLPQTKASRMPKDKATGTKLGRPSKLK